MRQQPSSASKQCFEVRGALAAPADETVPVETSAECSVTNICEPEPVPQDIFNMLPKVTLLKAALDSGAGDHVASALDLEGIKIHDSEGSHRGRNFLAANGDKIPRPPTQCSVMALIIVTRWLVVASTTKHHVLSGTMATTTQQVLRPVLRMCSNH